MRVQLFTEAKHTVRGMSKESESSEDISSMLEKLTKLFEEGILTKEELKRKSDELISQI